LQLSEWESTDSRALTRCAKTNGELDVGALYRLRMFGDELAPFAWFVWEGFAPSKAKFFAWLLIQSRIQSRAALLKKQALSARSAGVTARPGAEAGNID
jgi:hypothetical protein